MLRDNENQKNEIKEDQVFVSNKFFFLDEFYKKSLNSFHEGVES